jgi:hypothetical protein
VWLKRPGNPDEAVKLVAASKDLAPRVPKVRVFKWGGHTPSGKTSLDFPAIKAWRIQKLPSKICP